MVSDDDRELYVINIDAVRAFQERQYFNKLDDTDLWLKDNVFNQISESDLDIYGFEFGSPQQKDQVKSMVYDFVIDINWYEEKDVEFWGYFAAYDHVCLAQLFGRMIDLPPGMPMFTNDLMTIGKKPNSYYKPKPTRPADLPEHHALNDAKYQKLIFGAWNG